MQEYLAEVALPIHFHHGRHVEAWMPKCASEYTASITWRSLMRSIVVTVLVQDWTAEIYRCEPALRERVQGRDDCLRFAN